MCGDLRVFWNQTANRSNKIAPADLSALLAKRFGTPQSLSTCVICRFRRAGLAMFVGRNGSERGALSMVVARSMAGSTGDGDG